MFQTGASTCTTALELELVGCQVVSRLDHHFMLSSFFFLSEHVGKSGIMLFPVKFASVWDKWTQRLTIRTDYSSTLAFICIRNSLHRRQITGCTLVSVSFPAFHHFISVQKITSAILRLSRMQCRAIAQPVSPRFPPRRAGFEPRSGPVGFVVDRSGAGVGLLRVLLFPLPLLIPTTAPHQPSSIVRGWYNRLISDWRSKWTQSHLIPKKPKRNYTAQVSVETLAVISEALRVIPRSLQVKCLRSISEQAKTVSLPLFPVHCS